MSTSLPARSHAQSRLLRFSQSTEFEFDDPFCQAELQAHITRNHLPRHRLPNNSKSGRKESSYTIQFVSRGYVNAVTVLYTIGK